MSSTVDREAAETRTVRGACPHDCPDTCALRVTVRDGIAIKVQGEPDHPPTQGVLCTKVSRYTERSYHDERVLHPLKRIGPKGSGRFTRVSWDEALADIAAHLGAIAERDAQAIVPYSYAGTMGLVQGESMDRRFFHRLGASLLDRSICSAAGAEALTASYGGKVGMHVEHFAESRLILIWGSNSIASNLHFWAHAQAAKRTGAKLVCIDPRRTGTADKCHEHLQLLPGSDGALALGLMHELIAADRLDHDYIERHTEGWPALRARALAWPPERTAAVCGLQPEQVRALARDYGATRPVAIRLNYGMQRVRGGGNAVRLIATLPCLVGAWRHPAGGLLLSSSGWFPIDRAALQRPELLAGRAVRTVNMSTIGDDLLRPAHERLPDGRDFGPRIEALVGYNSNPVAVAPQSAKVVRGFAREDLFTVVLEHFLTEIFRRLAARMGMDDPCLRESDEQIARAAFGEAIAFDELRARGHVQLKLPAAPFANGGFPTPSGKCRIDAPGWGVPDYVSNHESAASTPALAARYPLAMISPPARNFLNSGFVNVKSLRDIEGEPLLEMHPADAVLRGIANGAPVRVFNDRGEDRCTAALNERARPGVVNCLGIWWRKLGMDGRNVNELTHQHLTDLGRAPSFFDCLVEVARA